MSDRSDWISRELFKTVLERYFHENDVQILDYTVIPNLSTEKSYTTDLFKVAVTYSRNNIETKEVMPMIIKTTHHDHNAIEIGEDFEIFETETTMYTKILPKIYNILEKFEELAPKCISSIEEPKTALILEDLSSSGFKTSAELQGLDLDHCILVVEKLARLHAATFVLQKTDPSLIQVYNEGLYREHSFTTNWLNYGIDRLIKVCKKWPGCEKYITKLELIKGNAVGKTLEAKKINAGDFNVLNHGDCWINNIMFSYNTSGKPNELRFIDFQFMQYGSPVIDLLYFWVTSANFDVRTQHLNTILHHYYQKLTTELTKLKISLENMFTEEKLKEEFYSRAFYGFTSAVTTLPVATDLYENPSKTEEYYMQHDYFDNKLYQQHMKYLFPFFENLGILD